MLFFSSGKLFLKIVALYLRHKCCKAISACLRELDISTVPNDVWDHRVKCTQFGYCRSMHYSLFGNPCLCSMVLQHVYLTCIISASVKAISFTLYVFLLQAVVEFPLTCLVPVVREYYLIFSKISVRKCMNFKYLKLNKYCKTLRASSRNVFRWSRKLLRQNNFKNTCWTSCKLMYG